MKGLGPLQECLLAIFEFRAQKSLHILLSLLTKQVQSEWDHSLWREGIFKKLIEISKKTAFIFFSEVNFAPVGGRTKRNAFCKIPYVKTSSFYPFFFIAELIDVELFK